MRNTRSDNRTWKDRRSTAFWIPLLLIVGLAQPALAVPGAPDTTFSSDGKLTTLMTPSTSGYGALAASVAIQTDGKIVVAGQAGGGNSERFALARYLTSGALDPNFSGDGKVTTPFGSSFAGARSVAIQSDGKIVAAGWKVAGNNTVFALARYKTNGNLDQSFGTNGKKVTGIGSNSEVASVAIQSDGKIVAAGNALIGTSQRFALARYLTNGNLDLSFGVNGNGKVTTPIGIYAGARSVAIQTDGKIVAAGNTSTTSSNSLFGLARYTTNGNLDTSFGGTGTITTPFGSSSIAEANSLAIQSDGKIVAVGYRGSGNTTKFAVARYLANGNLDTSFGVSANGKVTTTLGPYSVATSVAIQPSDGKIVVAGSAIQGSTSVFSVARYDPVTGTLDISFDGDGKVTTLIGSGAYGHSIAIQPSDGQLVVSGQASTGNHHRFAVVRYDD